MPYARTRRLDFPLVGINETFDDVAAELPVMDWTGASVSICGGSIVLGGYQQLGASMVVTRVVTGMASHSLLRFDGRLWCFSHVLADTC